MHVARHHRNKHINVKEMLAVLQALERWGSRLEGCLLYLAIDNTAVVGGIAKPSIKGPAMAPLRSLLLAARWDIELHPYWIPTTDNYLADSLSHFEWCKIANWAPQLMQASLSTSQDFTREPPQSWYADQPDLSRQAARYLWWGLAASTRRAYSTARRSYAFFYGIHGIPPFPATHTCVIHWVASLGGPVQVKTIKLYLSGLRSLHVDMGHPLLDIFKNPCLDRTIPGIKRFYAQSSREKRLPIIHNLLLVLLHSLSKHTSDMDQANVYTAFCVAFTGF
jgi:hypothetical protein